MKITLYALLLLFSVVSCQKNDEAPNSKTKYTASYTLSSNVCPENYGFREKNSTDALENTYFTNANMLNLELVVKLCTQISSSNLPQTIPAVIYKNGEVFLSIDLIRSSSDIRSYTFSFHHYK
jgi:hypothetical protein